MSQFRIKIELNKGRHGIPLHKLADFSKEAEKFLEMFAADLNLEKDGWIAENFENGSLTYDISYIGEFDTNRIANAERAFIQIISEETSHNQLEFGIRKETFWQFAQIANHIGPDDSVGIGLYQNGKPEIKNLSKERSLEIKARAGEKTLEFGGIQGEITALLKGRKHIWIRDFASNNRVVCTFRSELYDQIWHLLESQDTIVDAEGWITRANGEIEEFLIEKINAAAEYQEGDLEKFFGLDPDFTGNLSTEEYLTKLRGADEKESS